MQINQNKKTITCNKYLKNKKMKKILKKYNNMKKNYKFMKDLLEN